MKEIVLYPNKVLRAITKKVTEVDERLLADVADLVEVLESNEHGAGLAAPQIGIERRFFGIKELKSKKVKVVINPEITGVWGKKDWIKLKSEAVSGEDKVKDEDFLEGCLSFPNIYGTVKRWLKIQVSGAVIKHKKLVPFMKELHGFEAIVFQHELDHLEGILFIDHIQNDGGKIYRQVGEKMEEISLKDV